MKRTLAVLLALAALAPLAAHAQTPSTADAEARHHYERADAFRDREEWREALREYRASLALKKTRGAMASAAACLRALGLYDEALDQYEELLREFPALPPTMRVKVDPAIAELRQLTGMLTIAGDGLAGASLFVDDRRRGAFPAVARLRLSVGTHVVRVEKDGFEPITLPRVAVQPGRENTVTVEPKGRRGRVRVVERHNLPLDVELDGAVVGKAPWDGFVAEGRHEIRVHGRVRADVDDDAPAPGAARDVDLTEMASDRVPVDVKSLETSDLALSARDLDTVLRVDASPASASIAIDGVARAHGVWEGRLPLGRHVLEVGQGGFLTARRAIVLERRKQPDLHVDLAPAPRLGPWGPKRNAAVGFAFTVGAAGVTAGAVAGVDALVTVAGVRSHCNFLVCPASQASAVSRANTLAKVSDVALAVGAVGLVAGTILVFTYRPYDGDKDRSSALRVSATPGGLEVGGSF